MTRTPNNKPPAQAEDQATANVAVRFLKFDAQAIDALTALGFNLIDIADKTDTAIAEGEMKVMIMRTADTALPEFVVNVVLPKALLAAHKIQERCGLRRGTKS